MIEFRQNNPKKKRDWFEAAPKVIIFKWQNYVCNNKWSNCIKIENSVKTIFFFNDSKIFHIWSKYSLSLKSIVTVNTFIQINKAGPPPQLGIDVVHAAGSWSSCLFWFENAGLKIQISWRENAQIRCNKAPSLLEKHLHVFIWSGNCLWS